MKSSRGEAKNASELIGSLEGACAHRTKGWWTYKWCHRREVRQYHQVNSKREPDWSLGTYSRSEGGSEDSPADAIASTVDVFDIGGQHCDETQQGRVARVTFSCCNEEKLSRKNDRLPITKKSSRSAIPATLSSILETQRCEYSIVVSLEGKCHPLQDGWWIFEFCYKKHARQYHSEIDEKNGRKERVVQEFLLGKRVSAGAGRDAEDDLLLVTDDGEPRIELEYEQGTDCDIADATLAQRATTVRILCGDEDALASVVEDRTCHYIFTIRTPLICRHPAFSAKPNARSVQCNKLDPPT